MQLETIMVVIDIKKNPGRSIPTLGRAKGSKAGGRVARRGETRW